MSSPAKRRKKNDYDGSNQPVRSLDYFFAKQHTAPKDTRNVKKELHEQEIEKKSNSKHIIGTTLTDEELARKLQEEWNNEPALSPRNGKPEDGRDSRKEYNSHDIIYAEKSAEPNNCLLDSKEQKQSAPIKSTLALQSTAAEEDTVSTIIPFDESPLTFEPSKYIPDLQKHWATDSGHATYALLTRCFVLVNSTQSRIKIVDTLVNLLRTIIEGDPESLLPAVWLATNSISPPYIDLELGLGGSAISKALKKVCGLDNNGLRTLYNKYGDAGDVAFEAKKRQSFTLRKPKQLTIRSVFDSLAKIANTKGTGSQEIKQRIVDRLIQDARGAEESRYIVRTLVQHLRIGAVKTTMLIALSRAFLLSKPPNASFSIRSTKELASLKKEQLNEVYSPNEEIVKACYARRPNYNDLVPTLLEIGVCDELLLRCGLALHIPLRPMLGSITRDMGEMLTKLQGRDFSCEFKYDGQRAQVHCDDRGKVTIFSRHLEVMTDKYPDLVALVPQIRGEGVSSFIMEGEVVAIDRETGELKAFQTLSNRARKDVVIGTVKIDVCLFAFDLMYLNGESLLDRSFRERRNLLRSLFFEVPHQFTWVKSLDATSEDGEKVSVFFKEATDIKCEGIMVKILDNLPNPDLLDEENLELFALSTTQKLPPTPQKTKGKSKIPTNGPKTRRKALLATYEPDKRLESWLKVKKDYHSSTDTLDLIPIAGWHGQGRKSKWWSPVLMAVRNPETGILEAVTKCMSGFTDKFYKEMRAKYDPGINNEDEDKDSDSDSDSDTKDKNKGKEEDIKPQNTLPSKPSYVDYNGGHPDVWFEPQEVWEMLFADITLSPTYTAALGLVSQERGLSLRFPRFLRKREDKGIEEASTSDFLAELWRKQEARAPTKGNADAAEAEEVEEE
ncbi:ATP-dependent DNA ligase [Patellaria atrata CBS 101060]|uniref:DNA ligase n=1 Tax=Patellaria atrata CBS 101060 TaxID=1346257 RepID=A0A9P4S580_9PEZI|nr:ATP-dependent DNA ligase [Patellaria atrata CBS 101060]